MTCKGHPLSCLGRITVSIEGICRSRRLPHWDVAGATYFVTACLADSIPARGLLDVRSYRRELDLRPRLDQLDEAQWEKRKHKLVFARIDHWLDTAPAARYLENPKAAQIVRDSLYHFADDRYCLLAYVIMPSHYHWVFRPNDQWCELMAAKSRNRTPREQIMHSIQSYSANQCNAALGRRGTFWQDETYDHCVRDDEELQRIIEYVEQNPVKAGLVDRPEMWSFSSAFDRSKRQVARGEALQKQPVS
jgi:REP-associated tyrosine transposase